MNRLIQVYLLCFPCILVLVLNDFGDANRNTHNRQRRYLSFRNNSHLFVRLNFKANMVPWNQIFAQAIGFRLNYDEPPETHHPFRHLRVYRSTMYKHLEVLFDSEKSSTVGHSSLLEIQNGLSGFHCMRRAICEMRITTEPEGIYQRILEIIFRRSPATEDWFNFTLEECPVSFSECPFSLHEVSQYTDL